TSPSIAVCHYYYTKGRYFESDVYLNYHCRGSRFYKTDDNGAIVLTIRKNRIGSEKWIKNEILRYQTRKKRAPHKEIKNKKKILTFSSIDTGAGNAYLIRTPDNKNYLFNGGRYGDEENISDAGKGIIVPFLKKRKIRSLDGVFLINTVKENIGGLYSVLGSISAGRIYKSPYTSSSFEMSKVNEIASINNIPVRILKDNESISLGRDVKCRVLNPSESGSDEKDSSLVLKITYKDFSLLITGDIQGRDFADEKVPSIRTSEYTLLKNHKDELNSLIMTVPDSGYKNSSTFPFLEAVDPQYAILNIRKFDRYNPSDDVLSRYQMIDSRVWRSDYDGNIDVYSDGHAVQIETEE
ncbi:MAG: hypothetical protein KKH98_00285, partial [Spirochaetes bacterium]|nr:hypothetical protein [Spirochaetota bacterium]